MKALAAFVRRINLRYWARHRLRTSLTVFGVAIGVTLVVAISVINSTLLTTVGDTARSVAGDADIEVAAPDSTGLHERTISRVAEIEGVKAAVPVLRSYTTLHSGSASQRVLVVGTTFDFHWLFAEAADEGALDISGKLMMHNGVLLASETAGKLGLSLGDELEAQTPSGTSDLALGGSFSGSLVERLETGDLGIMPLATAQSIFDREDRVDSVYVVAEEDVDLAELEEEVSRTVGASAITGPPGVRVRGFEDVLNGIAAITSLAGTVALFVSAFVVFNTMSMSIVERRKEISLTLALGATRKQVMAGFVGEAAVLGLVACFFGIAAGYFLASLMVQPGLDGLRVFGITAVAGASLTWGHVLLGLLSGVAVSVLASHVPARRILKVAPVEALRPHGAYQVQGSDGMPSRRRTILTWICGLALLAWFIASGPLLGTDLDNAALITNLSLLGLLGSVTLLLPSIVRGTLRFFRRIVPRRAGVPMRLALDSLLRNASRTTVTVGALAFTLGTVVAVGGALDSYRAEWGRSARAWYGGTIQVLSQSFVSLGSDQPLPASVARSIESVDGVKAVYPARYRIVNIDGRQTTVYIMPYDMQLSDDGMPSYGDADRDRIGRVLQQGRIVISALASEKKGLDVGDRVAVPTPTGIAHFEVGAVVSDLNPLDSMYLSNGMFLEHWRAPAVDRFEVSVENGASRAVVKEEIRSKLDKEGAPVVVRTSEELVAETFEPIDQVFSVAQAVQLVALIVAVLAIANTMFITVIERRWELGLQRAVGMDGASVTRTLLAEAGVIGLIGAVGAWLVGIVTGWLMVEDMERAYTMSFPFEIPIDLMGLTLLIGALIAVLAAAFPSRTAVHASIVESLRFE